MRLISGSAGGIPIEVPKTVTRPTQDRVRQAIFSMLAEVIADARVLDLFAGSGAFGLECLSRGAQSCLFVDQDRRACDVIRRNAVKTRLPNTQVRQAETFHALQHLHTEGQRFDLVFADPPYAHKPSDTDFTAKLLADEALPHLLPAGAYLLLESLTTRKPLAFDPTHWEQLTDRSYGTTRIVLLRRI